VDSTFNNIQDSAIEMAVPVDVVDSGFTGVVLDNVNLGGRIKDHWSSNNILEAGYYKNVRTHITFHRWVELMVVKVCHGCHIQGRQADMDEWCHEL
jgi:hypothetical protein